MDAWATIRCLATWKWSSQVYILMLSFIIVVFKRIEYGLVVFAVPFVPKMGIDGIS